MNSLTKKIFLCLCAVLTIFFSMNMLNAQDTAAEPQDTATTQQTQFDNPRTFALGIATLKEHGFGGIMRARFNHFAIDGSVGSLPWLIMYTTADGTTTSYDGAMSFHTDLSFLIFINSDHGRFQNGIRLGGLYDSVGGKGVMFGWSGELTFNTFALCFGVGIQYYPDLIEKVNERFPATKNADLGSSYKYQPYLGINFVWYLF
jgi:hypothetical protein